VAIDRSSIQRSDFPTVRRGYDPAAVDRHLSEVADQVESTRRSAGQPVAAAASAQVQRIIEAAESTAEQLRTEAGEEAREHVHRVSTAAAELLERISAMHDELGTLMDRMREEAGRLSTELRSLERDVGEIGAGADGGAEAPGEAEAAAPQAATGSRAATSAATPGEAPPSPDARPEDEEAARIVALDMALAGTPREETERYLGDHSALADPATLLDDVYALAGS
jgi:DivIVA domain-containing protein